MIHAPSGAWIVSAPVRGSKCERSAAIPAFFTFIALALGLVAQRREAAESAATP